MHTGDQKVLEEIEETNSLIQNARELREQYQKDPHYHNTGYYKSSGPTFVVALAEVER